MADPSVRGGSPFVADLLAGSTALVTGGGTGLGRAIALGLSAAGHVSSSVPAARMCSAPRPPRSIRRCSLRRARRRT